MKILGFSIAQRALTVAGLAPFALLGCAVQSYPQASAANLPPPSYTMVLPLPQPLPASPQLEAAAAPRALVQSVYAVAKNFNGVVGVAVKSVDEGWTIASNGDLKLPQQSVSKLWVAMTVLDQRDRGKLRLEDPITVTRSDLTVFHQPIAALAVKDTGYTTTVGELMKRALTMSDNTCNDKLLRLVGGPAAVREFIARKQLGAIRFGPGEKLLQAGTAGLEWRPEYSMGNAFAQARARLPQSVRLKAFEAYVSNPPDGAAPSAIAGALAKLRHGALLSPSSTQWLIATMQASHTGRQRLRGAVPAGWQFGHKTGTGQDLSGRTAGYNDVGILTAPDGKSYAVAVMIGDTPRPIPERQGLMQAVVRAIVANHRS
jgi:beta-lactamase class A